MFVFFRVLGGLYVDSKESLGGCFDWSDRGCGRGLDYEGFCVYVNVDFLLKVIESYGRMISFEVLWSILYFRYIVGV